MGPCVLLSECNKGECDNHLIAVFNVWDIRNKDGYGRGKNNFERKGARLQGFWRMLPLNCF